jgi:hypothetical protein
LSGQLFASLSGLEPTVFKFFKICPDGIFVARFVRLEDSAETASLVKISRACREKLYSIKLPVAFDAKSHFFM